MTYMSLFWNSLENIKEKPSRKSIRLPCQGVKILRALIQIWLQDRTRTPFSYHTRPLFCGSPLGTPHGNQRFPSVRGSRYLVRNRIDRLQKGIWCGYFHTQLDMNHNWIHHPENTLETEHDQCVRGPLDPYPSLRISERCLLASICFMRDFQPYLVATSQCLTLFILKYPTFSLKIRDPYPLSTGESSFSPIKSVLVGLFQAQSWLVPSRD